MADDTVKDLEQALRFFTQFEGPSESRLEAEGAAPLRSLLAGSGYPEDALTPLMSFVERAIANLQNPELEAVAQASFRIGSYTESELEARLMTCAQDLLIQYRESQPKSRRDARRQTEPPSIATMRRRRNVALRQVARWLAEHSGAPEPLNLSRKIFVARAVIDVNVGADRALQRIERDFTFRSIQDDELHEFAVIHGPSPAGEPPRITTEIFEGATSYYAEPRENNCVRTVLVIDPPLQRRQRHRLRFATVLTYEHPGPEPHPYYGLKGQNEGMELDLSVAFAREEIPTVIWWYENLGVTEPPGSPRQDHVLYVDKHNRVRRTFASLQPRRLSGIGWRWRS